MVLKLNLIIIKINYNIAIHSLTIKLILCYINPYYADFGKKLNLINK